VLVIPGVVIIDHPYREISCVLYPKTILSSLLQWYFLYRYDSARQINQREMTRDLAEGFSSDPLSVATWAFFYSSFLLD